MNLIAPAIAGAMLVISLPSYAQTGAATSNGTCSIANSGNNVESLTINCGIGKEQGQKIIDLLNHALASKDTATINAKLDELLEITKQQPRLQPNHLYADGVDYGSAQSQKGPDTKTATILMNGFSALPGYEGKTLLYNYNNVNLKIICPPVSTAPMYSEESHVGMTTVSAMGLTCRIIQ